MRIAITGGTGFVGTHLADQLLDGGHEVVLIARGSGDPPRLLERSGAQFVAAPVTDREALAEAFDDCEAVAHLAGINMERGDQTYEAVHVEGTRAVARAAEDAGVSTLLVTSYLRARPDCGSRYLESKWTAEEIVRGTDLSHAVLKPGLVYGPGDQLLHNVARSLATVPLFPRVGIGRRRVRPLAVEDLVDVLEAAIVDDRPTDRTVPVVGPEEVTVSELVRRIGTAVGRRPLIVPAPVLGQYAIAWLQEKTLEAPIVTRAGIRMLAEGATESAPDGACDPLPDDLEPNRAFTVERIRAGLSGVRRLGLSDLRF